MTTLRELGTRPRRSQAWEPGSPDLVRFITDEGASYGFLWHALIFGAYVPEHESLFLQYGTGTIIIVGPKAEEFWEDFAQRKATSVKADGVDILSVTMSLRQRKEDKDE
jgi:hypothetical protein